MKHLKLFFACMLMTVLSIGQVWAADEVYKSLTFPDDNSSNNGLTSNQYVSTWTAKSGQDSWSIANFNNNNWNNWTFIKCGRKNNASVATIITDAAIDKAVTKVVITIDALTASKINSIKLYTSSNKSNWTEAGSYTKATGPQTVTLASPEEDLYYKVEFDCASGSSNGLLTLSKVEYYKAVETAANACVQPTFSLDAGIYTSARSVTISTTTDGATIYYTTDGSNPTTSSSVYSSAISVSETQTIKAMAVKSGMDNSTVASATYTILPIVHAGTQSDPYTVADARNAIDANTGLTGVYATGIVSEIVTAYNSQYGNISYNISADGLKTSDQLQAYRGKDKDAAWFTSEDDVQVGDVVVVYGTLKKYNSTYEFDTDNQRYSYSRPEKPSLSVNPTSINVDETAHAGQTIALTYENWGTVAVYSAEATLYDDQSCTTAFTGNWISNISVNGDNSSVSFDIAANTGAARSVYMKIYALGDDANTEAEKVISISQAKHEALATLPFAFDAGRGDIESKDGMSQEGLGTDYNSSPKLKFDGAGDYVIIHLDANAVPGKLSYDIKGNSFSGGTFKVQESADGSDYTDVATYSELGTTQSEEKNLAQTTRYVKFVYTTKDAGNVALGNIAIATYVAPAAVEAPTISGNESFLTSTTVTLSCETTGAKIYYTTDGTTDPKSGTEYSSPFTLTNSATVRAIAKLGDNWSEEATSKTFTKEEVLTTFEAIFDAATTAGNTPVDKYITLNHWVVNGVKGKNAFVSYGGEGVIIYATNHGFEVNDVLNGTVSCKVQLYNGAAELTDLTSTTSGLTVTKGFDYLPDTLSIEYLGARNTGALVYIWDLTYDGEKLTDEFSHSIKPYNGLYNNMAFENGKKYNVTGVINYYNALQIMPRSAADIQEIVDASAPATPTFSPEAGTYTSVQNVEISCATDGATIYYTTDGTTPTNESAEYTASIEVGENMTIKAIAINENGSSAVATAAYTINLPVNEETAKLWDLSDASYDANPTENEVTWSGTYVTMVINKSTSTTAANNYLGGDANNRTSTRFYKNSTLTITPNGKQITNILFSATSESYATAIANSTWTNGAAQANQTMVVVTVSNPGAVSVTIGATCGFTGVRVEYEDIAESIPSTPTFSLEDGTYTEVKSVTISTTTEGATIYYTTDGTSPTNTSTQYTTAISVEETMTIKAIAIKDGKSSAIATAAYEINLPEDENVSKTWNLSIDETTSASDDELVWTGTYVSMSLAKSTSQTKANNAYPGTSGQSYDHTRMYKDQVLSIVPNGKQITSVQFMTTNSSANALQSSTWTNATASVQGSMVTVTASGSGTVSAKIGAACRLTSVKVNYTDIVASIPATPTFSLEAGTYTSAQNVEISCATDGATIYYTTDGTTPTNASTEYTAAINVEETMTIKAVAIKGGKSSDVVSATYTINISEQPEEPVLNFETVYSGRTIGKYYTICLPKNILAVRGAIFWNLSKRNSGSTVYFEEAIASPHAPFEAGKPFIYLATATTLEVAYGEDETTTPIENGALRGTLENGAMNQDAIDAVSAANGGSKIYIMYNSELRQVDGQTGNSIGANRAYVLYNALVETSEAPAPAPGRRVVAVSLQEEVATGIVDMDAQIEGVQKVLIDGELFIIRNGNRYDMTGNLVK